MPRALSSPTSPLLAFGFVLENSVRRNLLVSDAEFSIQAQFYLIGQSDVASLSLDKPGVKTLSPPSAIFSSSPIAVVNLSS